MQLHQLVARTMGQTFKAEVYLRQKSNRCSWVTRMYGLMIPIHPRKMVDWLSHRVDDPPQFAMISNKISMNSSSQQNAYQNELEHKYSTNRRRNRSRPSKINSSRCSSNNCSKLSQERVVDCQPPYQVLFNNSRHPPLFSNIIRVRSSKIVNKHRPLWNDLAKLLDL